MQIFNEYIAMWKNYANFKDRTTVRGYWMVVLWNVVVTAILVAIGDAMESRILYSLYGLATIIPGLAITIRRLRDTGKTWTYIFMELIPIAGPIIMIVYLVKPSIPDDGTPVV